MVLYGISSIETKRCILHCILSIKLFLKQISVKVLESVIIFSRLVFLTYDCNKFAPERLEDIPY